MIYLDLTLNLSLLVALSVVSGFIENRWPRHTRLGVLLQGALFGGTAVLGMLRPLNLGPGLIFDGRSVMVSLCALFYGPWAATVAAVMTVSCRMGMGGAGALTGSLVILSSAGIGLFAHFRLKPNEEPPSIRNLYVFALIVHLVMLVLMFTLPGGAGLPVVTRIGLPVMLLYPLATILVGKILSDQVEARRAMEALQEREQRYTRLFNSGSDAVFVHDVGSGEHAGKFTEVNDVACARLGYSREELRQMSPEDIDSPGMEESKHRALETLAETGHAVFETIHVGRSGVEIPVEISSRVFESKEGRCVLSVARDITERKRAEAALKESEERYRAFFEHSLDAVLLTAPEGRILAANTAACQMFGRTEAEICQVGRNGLVDLDDPRLPVALEERKRTGRFVGELRFRRADESTFDGEASTGVFRDRNGEERTSMIIRDITERKAAEARLSRVNRALRMISICNDVLVRATTEEELLREVCRIVVENGGYRLAWIVYAGDDPAKMVRPAAYAGVEDGCLETPGLIWADEEGGRGLTGKAIQSGEPTIVRFVSPQPTFAPWGQEALRRGFASAIALPLRDPSRCFGALNIAAGQPDAFDDDEVAVLAELASDLCYGIQALRTRVAHEQARVEIESLARFPNENPNPVLRISRDGVVLYANRAGVPLLELWRAAEGHHLPDPERAIASELLREGAIRETEMLCGARVFSLLWVPVAVDGYVNVYGLDITERKRLEAERLRLEARLRQQQKLEAMGTLAGGVAHEINNPITGIMNYAQLIADKAEPGSQAAEYAGEIIQETSRVATVVKNLLQFARQEKEALRPARLEDILEQTLSLLRAVLRRDQITLTLDVPAGLLPLKCRSQQIQQVLMNLLTNARDALNERYAGYHADKTIRLSIQPFEHDGRPWLRVTVADRGAGIPADIRERIFDPFFTTKPRDQGSGLGLSISYGIAQEHHGALHFETVPGEGTAFHLDLPVDNGWTVEEG